MANREYNLMPPNQGLELLYTPDCSAWPQAQANLEEALRQTNLASEPWQLVPVETMEQAYTYNFFASPTIHIHGLDIEPQARRITRRALGTGRPYFSHGQALIAPPVELIVKAIKELY